jgi:hypothetical protein
MLVGVRALLCGGSAAMLGNGCAGVLVGGVGALVA